VILHAFFYGAFLRTPSPFTLLLVLSVVVVSVGQAVGMWLWRRRYAGVVAVSVLACSVPTAALAQHGPGRHRPDSGLPYDMKREATVTGTVVVLKSGSSLLSRLFRIHTLGVGHTNVQQRQLILRTDVGRIRIHLGPSTFIDELNAQIRKGDKLEVTGSRVTIGDSHVLVARALRKGDSVWTLRDAAGQPLWDSADAEPRGFWTAKKVLITVVVVKVVALATVLRH